MLLFLPGCGGALGPWLDDPERPLPRHLERFGDLAEQADAYEPLYPLWTNGSDKARFLALPDGSHIDAATPEWSFPDGTLIFKQFSFEGSVVETRVMRQVSGAWDFAVYLHDGGRTRFWDDAVQVPVEVSFAGQSFDHVVPSRLDCRTCHEAHPQGVIGIDALQLGVEALEDHGDWFASPPDVVAPIVWDDPLFERVLQWAQGNCAHCHDGGAGPNNAFDLRPDAFLTSTVGQPTDGLVTASGTRIVPGDPDGSVLFQAVSGETDDPEVKAMPPLGVQILDERAIEDLRSWIASLEGR